MKEKDRVYLSLFSTSAISEIYCLQCLIDLRSIFLERKRNNTNNHYFQAKGLNDIRGNRTRRIDKMGASGYLTVGLDYVLFLHLERR